MKWLGMVMVIAGCMGLGMWYSVLYTRKWKTLVNLQKAMVILRGEIAYGRTPLPLAFLQASCRTTGSVADFFETVSERMEAGKEGLEQIWNRTLHEIFTEREMQKEDRKELESLGNTLGYLDVEMQVQTITLYQKRLENSLYTYEKEKDKRTRLYPMLGTMGGALICIIMI